MPSRHLHLNFTHRPWIQAGLFTTASLLSAGPASGIDIRLDYTYDTQSFFGSGNPQGSAGGALAKAALEDAADFFSDLLDDTFLALETPPTFESQVATGTFDWEWSQVFTSPGSGSTVTIVSPDVPANEYIVYAGGRGIGGSTLGRGGPGGFSARSFGNGGGFSSSEIGQLNAISDAFFETVPDGRDPGGGFNTWGGVVAFDNDGSTEWNFDWQNPPVSGLNDFYSVAIHELGHALGFGGTEWEALVSDGVFTGTASTSENNGTQVSTSSDISHWGEDTMSVVRGTGEAQEAAMDPDLTTGTRKLWTDLDSAGLIDIGWEISAGVQQGLAGDYNGNGSVEQADLDLVLGVWGRDKNLDVWFNAGDLASLAVDQEELDEVLANWGSASSPNLRGLAVPEPAMGLLFTGLLGGLAMRRRV